MPLVHVVAGRSSRNVVTEKAHLVKSVHTLYFEEFLFDHVLRKVMMEPHEHVDWPPMLKLFYNFLYEKEYLKDSTSFINVIDGLESQFITVLRESFG
jgi:hypothetical protein